MPALTIDTISTAAALAGLTVLEQSKFFKIAADMKAVYVSKTKRGITRIDVSGFEVEHPAIRPPVRKNGKVTGQIDVSHDDALEALERALLGLTDGTKGTKPVA